MMFKDNEIVVTAGFERIVFIQRIDGDYIYAKVMRGVKDPDADLNKPWIELHFRKPKARDMEQGDIFNLGDDCDVYNSLLNPFKCVERDHKKGIMRVVSDVDGTKYELEGNEPIEFLHVEGSKL